MSRDMSPFPADEAWDTLGGKPDLVELLPHCPEWDMLARAEADRIVRACDGRVVAVEHIGSTAVPELSAKPILDLMPGIRRLEDGPPTIPAMEGLGYICRGEYGIPGRLFFQKMRGDLRMVHAHMFVTGVDDWDRHILFRDHLRTHPDATRAYEELKTALAARYPNDRDAYTDAKGEFILGIVERARQERR
jgi:GrpB-like predicted nucleotidyltransferase (UPF0157 family)